MAASSKPHFRLKFQGNKTFSAFTTASIAEEENIWVLHSVVTKVAAHLEEGRRLENLAWRLWYLNSAVVSSKKDREEFKKVSRGVADTLNKEKGRNLVDLPLPELNRSNSDRLANRVAEKSRNRRASRGGGENDAPSMSSMMGQFSLDKSVGVSKRRDSLPTGGKKPSNLKNKNRSNSPGPSGLTRSCSSRSTMENGRSRGRAPSRTELLMTPAVQQTHPTPPQPPSTFMSLPASSSTFSHSNQPSTSAFPPPPPPTSSPFSHPSLPTQSYPKPDSLYPQQSSLSTHPPDPISSSNHISLSIDDIFKLAHPSNPTPPRQPAPNQLSDHTAYSFNSGTNSLTDEIPIEDILRGLSEGGNSSTLDFADLGLDGWPAGFGGTDFGEGLPGGPATMSLDDLFANSGMMTGVEPSSLDSNATLRPQLPTGGSSFSTSIATPSVFSSSASPEEIQQQMLGVLAGSPFPQNDRVRRLSKANEPFLGRDEIGMGVGTGSGSSLDDVSAMGGFGGEEESPSRLQAQHRRSSTSRKSSGTSSAGSSSSSKGKGRVSSTNLSQPQEFIHPSTISPFDHPSKRRRGSEVSSDYSTSPAFVPAPWTPSALSPSAVHLPGSNINSPWNSNVHTPSLELTAGFEGMGVGGGFLSPQHPTQSPGLFERENLWSSGEGGEGGAGGEGGNASGFSFAVPSASSASSSKPPKASKNGKQHQQPSPSTRLYQPSSSASAPHFRAKQRTSSHSSISSQSASASSTPGTLTPYQAGFLSSFAPIQPSPTFTGPIRRSSESQSAHHSSGVRAEMQRQQQQIQLQQQKQRPSFSTPVSPNRRAVGLPGSGSSSSNSGGGFGGGKEGTTRPVRLTLQEQLELAGMVPKSSKPIQPSRQHLSSDPSQQTFDFAMGSSLEFKGDASRGGGGGGGGGGEKGGANFGNGGGGLLGAVPEG